MQLLDRIVRCFAPAAEPQKPGRHSDAGILARVTAERDEARRRSDHHLNLLRGANAEVMRLQRLLGQDAGLPATRQPAPADRPDFQPEPADPPTPADGEHLLTELVEQDPEATQSLGVSAVRAAAQMDAGHTQQLPAVSDIKPPLRLDPVPPVTWRPKPLWEGRARDAESAAIEATLGIPGPDPLHSATAVPPGIPEEAQLKVAAAMSEAS